MRYELRPMLLSRSKFLRIFGLRKSTPTRHVLSPDMARVEAKFDERNVFPSPPIEEVTIISFPDPLEAFLKSSMIKFKLATIPLKDSVTTAFGFLTTIRPSSFEFPIAPKMGIGVITSMSFLLRILLLMESNTMTTTMGKAIPINKPIKRFLLLFGEIGLWNSAVALSITCVSGRLLA